jgi:hypothetical protein
MSAKKELSKQAAAVIPKKENKFYASEAFQEILLGALALEENLHGSS